MDINKEIIHLLLRGQLPLQAVDETLLPKHLLPVLRSIEYSLAHGEQTPLVAGEIWKIAKQRYLATDEVKFFLREVSDFTPNSAALDSIRESLVLKQVTRAATEQLAKGEYDIETLRKLLNTTTDRRSYLYPIGEPKEEDEAYNYKSGIVQLDSAVIGFKPELVIVAARPKQGKSNFFINLACRAGERKVLYVSVSDYDNDDLRSLVKLNTPEAITRTESFFIADYTGYNATILDVESAISDVRPDIVIVDRAETMRPLRKHKDERFALKEIFNNLRQLAKKYTVPVFTDSQLSAEGEQEERKKNLTYSMMSNDKTERAAVMDIFIGLHRVDNGVYLNMNGRRPGLLPADVFIPCDKLGRYLE